jgi:hypothetical protein
MLRFRATSGLLLLPLALASCALLRSAPEPVDSTGDERIRAEVTARLAAEPSIGPGRVRVEVRGGTVMLHGSVKGIGALQCAITNAGLAVGTRTVVDYLVLERGPRDVRCLAPRPDTGVVAGHGP